MGTTVLKVLLICASVCAILSFVVKRPPRALGVIEAAFFIAYEIFFIIFHPLIGILCSISFIIMMAFFYMDDERFKAVHNLQVYIPLIILATTLVYEVVETFTGRLF